MAVSCTHSPSTILNGLMMVDIQDHLDGRYLGLMRSAGSIGARAFDELVNRHWKPFYQVLPDEIAALCDCSFAPLCACADVVPWDGFHSYGVDVLGFKRRNPEEKDFVSGFEKGVFGEVSNGVRNISFVEQLRVSGCSDLSRLPPDDLYFLKGWHRLEYVRFTDVMVNVRSIPSNYLASCRCLRDVDLRPFANVTTIQSHFLQGCWFLDQVDLTPMTQISNVGDCFLKDCISLEHINLQPLAHITNVQPRFLEGCSSLSEVDLSPMTQIASIGDCFLKECKSLERIDLTPLSRVTCVGQWFLSDCSSLEKVDLTPISSITAIKYSFMKNCSNLQKIDLAPLSKAVSIDACFMRGCKALEKINLERLINVTSVGPHFLEGCELVGTESLKQFLDGKKAS